MTAKNLFEIAFKVFVVVGLIVTISLHLDSRQEIVYVDSIKLLSKYTGMELARKDLKAKTDAWQSNLEILRAEADRAMAALEQNKGKVSAQRMQELRTGANQKQVQFANYQQTIADQYKKEDEEVSRKLLTQVNEYIKRYGEQHNYDIIFAATHYGNIAYAKKAKDITDDVIAGLNASFRNK